MEKLSRKEFLQRLAMVGFGAIGAGSVLNACGGGGSETASKPAPEPQPAQTAAPANDPCSDVTGLTEAEVNMRGTFKYVAQTPEPAKKCNNCALWIAEAAGASCGGCQIIKGPINPAGWCMQWVAVPAS